MPTPILVTSAERRCRIATEANLDEGRPCGLYGNRFAAADTASVARAVTILEPPTVSHILAVEAPSFGTGRYTLDQIRFILRTAYSGFLAVRAESRRVAEGASDVCVHTGFWGGGAYGGNRVLMTVLQVLAARMAGLDRLVFHTVDADGTKTYEEGLSVLADDLDVGAGPMKTDALIHKVEAMGLKWGVGDGN